MGIFDFVKQGTQEMCIARPDAMKSQLVYKHPDQNIPMYAQLTIDSDECAVFFKDGKVVGVLGPGRHTLQSSNIPFLGLIVDKFTGGNLFIAEVYFVKTQPIRDLKFGATLNRLRDPDTGLTVSPKIYGSFVIQIMDPGMFVVKYNGQQGALATDTGFFSDLMKSASATAIGTLFKTKQLTFLDIGSAQKQIGAQICQDAPEFAEWGVRVLLCMPTINFSEEDEKKIAEFADADSNIVLEQKRGMAEAARQQAKIDQQFNKDARYVQQLAGNYNNYAAGQAMMGAGQGMAKGGEGSGVALMGAQMAAGMGMGQAMGGQFGNQQGMPQFQPQMGGQNPQAPAPPQTPQQAAAGTISCGGCHAVVPVGKFCQECGTTLGSAKKFCTGCGAEIVGGAKFCAGCGTRASAAP